jgi:ATP-dependent DNA helicase RecQ
MFNAAKVLEREGLIAIPERNETESRVYIPLSQEELYRFQVSQARYSDLLTLLLRMYGGLFTDFVPISERALARRLNLDEQQITNMLHHMDALKAIQYKAKTTKPQIIFTAPRVNVESLTLTESNYNTLKQHATERLEAMLHYVDSTQCRSSFLLQYFGEQSSQPCGICDRCIQSHSTTPQLAVRDDLRTAILKHLQQQPLRVDELLEKISGVEESTLVDTLRTLVDERTVSINQSLQFFV